MSSTHWDTEVDNHAQHDTSVEILISIFPGKPSRKAVYRISFWLR